MSIIKPSTAFKSFANWVSADVRTFMIEQVALHVDTVADVNNNDFEQSRWLHVKTNGALYRLDLSSSAADDGDGVLRDNIGRRYIKVTSAVRIGWDDSGTFANRATHDGAAKGYVYAVTDGTDLVLYVKESATSGDWSNGFTWRGPAGADGSSNVVGTSTSSLAIGIGTKTFTIVESARGWGLGARLRASSNANGANFMEGVVTSYSGVTLAISVDLVGGSGTKADWTINLTGQQGSAGGVLSVATLTGTVLAPDLRDALDAAPYVLDRAALKALTFTKDATAIMQTDRAGVWRFRDGDISDLIAADTSETTYVRPSGVNANTFASTWDLVTGWTTFGSVPTNGATAGPYSERSAASIKEDGSTGGHGIFISKPFTTGLPYTLSGYIKQGVGTRNVTLSFGSAFPVSSRAATFNPSTGAVVAKDVGITTTVALVNGYYRVSITATTNATTPDTPVFKLASGTSVSYAGDNTSLVYVAGAKLEQAAAPTTIGGWLFSSDRFVGQFASPAIRTIDSKLWDRADLRDWNGLDLTDTNDNATLVQAAFTAMSGTGNKLHIPAGQIVLGSQIIWPTACHVEGSGRAGGAYLTAGCFFHIGHTGIGFKVQDNLGSRSLKNISTYRTQPAPGGGAYTPTAHDYDFDFEGGQDIELENITMLNPTKGINIRGMQTGAVPCGRIALKGIRGQPLSEGIRMTHCTDVVYLDEIHFWPLWSGNANVMTYTRANLSSLLMARVDNPQIGRFFCFGAFRGMNIYNQGALGSLPTGTVARLACQSFDADNCNVAMVIGPGADGVTADFGAFHCASDPAAPSISTESFIGLLANNANINIGALRGQYTNACLVAINGTGNNVTIANSESAAIANAGGGVVEFSVDNGNKLRLLSPPKTSAAVVYSATGDILPRGVMTDRQIATVQGTKTALSNSSTAAQNIFAAAIDTFTVLAATTYRFRAKIGLNTGATSHTTSFGLGGTATFTTVNYDAFATSAAAATLAAPQMREVSGAAAAVLTAASTAVRTNIRLEGIIRVNAGGTIIPQITFSAGPTGTCEVDFDSFFELEPIGSNTVAGVGNLS